MAAAGSARLAFTLHVERVVPCDDDQDAFDTLVDGHDEDLWRWEAGARDELAEYLQRDDVVVRWVGSTAELL